MSTTLTKPTEKQLYAFQNIVEFIQSLKNYYGEKNKQLNLYNRLVAKTYISDTQVVLRHVEVFRLFCVSNREAISERDTKKFTNSTIHFSDRIMLNIADILDHLDPESKLVAWDYILVIDALLDPENGAKQLLTALKNNSMPISDVPLDAYSNNFSLSSLASSLDPTMIMSLLGGMGGGLNGSGSGGGGDPMNILKMVGNMMTPENIQNMFNTTETMFSQLKDIVGDENNPQMNTLMNSLEDVMVQMKEKHTRADVKLEERKEPERDEYRVERENEVMIQHSYLSPIEEESDIYYNDDDLD
jgi:hypothetical protein